MGVCVGLYMYVVVVYKSSRSPSHLLMSSCIDRGYPIDVIYLDFQKAFDKVPHKRLLTRMWANAQPDGRPAEHRWRPLFNAPKFG